MSAQRTTADTASPHTACVTRAARKTERSDLSIFTDQVTPKINIGRAKVNASSYMPGK